MQQNKGFPRQLAGRSFAARLALFLLGAFTATAHCAESASNLVPYSLVGVARFDGIAYASLLDPETHQHFILATGKPEQGLILAAVTTDEDPVGPSARVQKDGVSFLLKLKSAAVMISSKSPGAASALASMLPMPGTGATNPKPPPGGTLPLAFQEVDPNKLMLSDDQKSAIDQVRQQFLATINGKSSGSANSATTSPGATNQNASAASADATSTDPQLKSWQTAQYLADEQLRTLMGWQAFSAYEMALSNPSAL